MLVSSRCLPTTCALQDLFENEYRDQEGSSKQMTPRIFDYNGWIPSFKLFL